MLDKPGFEWDAHGTRSDPGQAKPPSRPFRFRARAVRNRPPRVLDTKQKTIDWKDWRTWAVVLAFAFPVLGQVVAG